MRDRGERIREPVAFDGERLHELAELRLIQVRERELLQSGRDEEGRHATNIVPRKLQIAQPAAKSETGERWGPCEHIAKLLVYEPGNRYGVKTDGRKCKSTTLKNIW
ncbi:hypothetical protein A0H81_14408 [Grifola frondosa]|uniref:Uncharacterized protein n=1 Tax=Grifola frondosa TaxID=5627 RepID=A0A1C7LLD6_GRIFR|nr:hypothetical protein A0H81_14408 [Grifola frondosa]